MTDVTFRVSGGVSPELSPEDVNATGVQVIPHGIGYDRIPISNAPSEELGDVLNEDTVASGAFMQFMSDGWEEGKFHSRGSVVTNGLFTMVADVLTLENPYPQPDGTPTRTIPAFAPLTQSDTSVIYSGMQWTLTADVLLKSLRIWVTQLTMDTHYRIVIIKTVLGSDPVTTIIDNPVLTAGAFHLVAALNQLAVAGTVFTIFIDALNSGSDQVVTGGWNFTGQSNNNAPAAQAWNHNNARTTLRIDKTDLDGTDRATELLGITPDSTVQFAQTDTPTKFITFRTTGAAVDSGTDVTWPVVVLEEGEGGPNNGVTTMTATVPIPQSTEYAEELTGLANPAWATVVPFLQFDGVDQAPASTTAFGVDLEAEITEFSEDWNVLAFNTT